MGTITAQSIVDQCQIILADTTGVRWSDTELLGWLNAGQREIVVHKPDSFVTNEVVQLAASTTKNTIPSTGVVFVKLTRNMGSDGSTPGKTIWGVEEDILNRENRDWHTATPAGHTSGEVTHVVYDPKDPKTYYVYPVQPNPAHYVEIVYASAPADVASIGNAITVDDIYANCLMDYVLYRAYSKDTDYAGNDARAQGHYGAFMNALKGKEAGEQANEQRVMVGRVNRAG